MSIAKRTWTTPKGEEKTAWVVRYTDSQKKRRLKTFGLKKKAEAFAQTVAEEIRDGTHVPDKKTITISAAANKWLTACEMAGLERSTIDQYRSHIRLHIDPFIGAEKLNMVAVPFVRSFQDGLREKGRSAAMVKRVTVTLGAILSDALDSGACARNAVQEMSRRRSNARAKRVERRQKARLQIGIDVPTREEIARIVEHASGRYRPLIIVAVFTGLRASELRGLRWSDVDLATKEIHVRQRADKYHVIGMPKTDASQRTLPLSPLVLNTLREWKLACPKGELGLVFPNTAGNVEWHQNIIKRGLWPIQIAAGVVVDTGKRNDDGTLTWGAKYTGLHSLRHFFASFCMNRRVDGGRELPMKNVQKLMGHSSIVVTSDTYGHLFPSTDDAESLASAERILFARNSAT